MEFIKKKPSSVYGQLLYYMQRFKLARQICIEIGLNPTDYNLMFIMGRDYFGFVEAQRMFREIINKSLVKKQKVQSPPRRRRKRMVLR